MYRSAVGEECAARVYSPATLSVGVTAARLFDEHNRRRIIPRRTADAKSGVEFGIQDV